MKYKCTYLTVIYCLLLLISSCSTPKNLAYIQNATFGQEDISINLNDIKAQPHDQISIVVSCREPELAQLFNLVMANKRVGATTSTQQQSQGDVSVYTVNSKGDISFPVLGDIHIAGLNREGISEKISRALIDGKWVNDPVVSVEFVNFHFSVVGEVNQPGTYSISNDKMTLLEAISMAGDLTIYGNREIIVIREADGKMIKYLVDLRTDDLFKSPAYYLQQNDIIYVSPNEVQARKAADNPNNWKSISMWISLASLLTTVAVLVFK